MWRNSLKQPEICSWQIYLVVTDDRPDGLEISPLEGMQLLFAVHLSSSEWQFASVSHLIQLFVTKLKFKDCSIILKAMALSNGADIIALTPYAQLVDEYFPLTSINKVWILLCCESLVFYGSEWARSMEICIMNEVKKCP